MDQAIPSRYHGLGVMAECVSLISVSVLSFCLSQRVPRGWRQWKHLTWGRTCVLWLFVFFSGLLSSGIGFSTSYTTCALAIYTCVSFYAISKVLIYAFLSEKVYIVWTGGNQTSRIEAKVYRVCAFVLLGYVAVGILTVLGRDSTVRHESGVCVIGLKAFATVSLIVYDMSLNIFLTAMFLWPLWKSHPMSPRLRSIAKRTLYGASTSLISSMINIAILFLLGGNELGWICISSCVADVTINSLALFWLSSSSSLSGDVQVRDRFSLPTMDMGALTFVHIDPTRPPVTTRQTASSQSDTLQPQLSNTQGSIPEAYFDYIPSEHRHLRSDEEKTEHVRQPTSISNDHSPKKSISGSRTTDSPDIPGVQTELPQDLESKHTIIEEKDISDL
ncbi:hypothetical protein FB446DRAFT_711801 [Lentinula raphanica]|nr:hypothetical protein FB446DRAFT_711801 [Lentinula raphanica]